MKNRLSLMAVSLVAVASTASAQTAPDAVAIDPTHHHVLFENEHVRVFRALASPGERSPMHSHPPFTFVSLGTARARLGLPDGTSAIFDIQPGQVLWLDNAQHSWEMLSGLLHVIAVEVKAATRGAPPPFNLPATDAVAVDPIAHQIVLENDHVRVLNALAGAGTRSPMHTHSGDFVIVTLGRGRLRLTPSQGQPVIVDFHPGAAIWLDRQAHAWEVVSGQLNVFAIELKSTRR